MFQKNLVCGVLVGCLIMLSGYQTAGAAEDKDAKAPAGSWSQKGSSVLLTFADKSTLKIFPHGADGGIVIVCNYTVEKDGGFKAKITDLEAKADVKEKLKEAAPVGLEFTFQWKAKDDTATFGDVKGEKVDHVKSHLEGDYEKKK